MNAETKFEMKVNEQITSEKWKMGGIFHFL